MGMWLATMRPRDGSHRNGDGGRRDNGGRYDGDGLIALPDLTGKTFLVTGASSGIGRVVAQRLAGAGATVLAHGRSAEKLVALARSTGAEPLLADFSRLAEVRRLACDVLERTDYLHAILHNAGAFHRKRRLTEDGHEATLQTNYLGPFLLQSLLHDLVSQTQGSRVVVTTSVAARLGRLDLKDPDRADHPYRPFRAYATTKLMGILFARELRRRLAEAGANATAAAVHPGAVKTDFGAGSMLPRFLYRMPVRKELLIGYFVATAEQGAEPLVRLAAASQEEVAQSIYFDRFVPGKPPTPLADDPELARALWERSEGMVRSWSGPW